VVKYLFRKQAEIDTLQEVGTRQLEDLVKALVLGPPPLVGPASSLSAAQGISTCKGKPIDVLDPSMGRKIVRSQRSTTR